MENTVVLMIVGLALIALGVSIGIWYVRWSGTLETRLINTAASTLTRIAHIRLDAAMADQAQANKAARQAALDALKAQVSQLQ